MSDVSIVSLILAVIALLISVYSLFRVMGSVQSKVKTHESHENETPPARKEESLQKAPQDIRKEVQNIVRDEDLRTQVQKFSLMVTKNLEQLNTRVGVKGNVKPLEFSGDSPKDKNTPNVVDSEVSDQ